MKRSFCCGENGGHLMRSVPEGSVGDRLELLETGSHLRGQMDAWRE